MERHHLLPTLVGTELSGWLHANAAESFKDSRKRYFEPEEIQDFEHESSAKGREINRLASILAAVTNAVKKGSEEDFVIEIPANLGTVVLDKQRKQNDDFVESGYEEEETRVFGLVDTKAETMEFFTEQGEHIKERSRGLSPKEKKEHLIGMVEMRNASNY